MGNSSKKESTNSSRNTIYGKTTTSNPYVTSTTNNKGTKSSFVEGSAYDTVNKFVNANTGKLLDEYLNPSLDSVTNKSKLNTYMNTLSSNAKSTFENDIINPLSDRNMIRSSQATNMYKNLSNNLSNNVASYANELLANSRSETASMLGTLLAAYMDGFNVVNANQNTSLSTSKGNAKSTGVNTSLSGSSSSSPDYIAMAGKLFSSLMS